MLDQAQQDSAHLRALVQQLQEITYDQDIRIKELEGIISLADVIDPKKLSGTIKFAATVTILDEDTEEESTFQIVGEPEADIEKNKLNVKSPLARALIGKDTGDSVEVKSPGGTKIYEIILINYEI